MTDAVIEKFVRFIEAKGGDVNLLELYNPFAQECFEGGYQAAHEKAKALVGELVRNWFVLNNHEGVEVSAAGNDAAKVWNDMCKSIDKAQAFMEGK